MQQFACVAAGQAKSVYLPLSGFTAVDLGYQRGGYEPFNRETQDGRKMETYSRLLQQSIHSMIHLKEEKDIDSLFSGGA